MSAGQVNCLVTGATGYIGARLVPHLLDKGHRVRALARDPNKLAGVPWRDRTEVARGDLGDVDSLIAAFDGVQVVYYLVHSMGTAKNFAVEEARAVRNVVEAARRAGVRRVVYLGGLHPDGRHLSPHLESRKAVGEALIQSGIETVVLQAGVVVGSGSASFEMIRHLTDRLPVMTTPKWVHNRIQPIAVRDVLYYLVAAATVDLPSSRTWDIGGPDVLEYGDMMRIYAEVAGLHRRYLLVLPFLTPRIASLWVGTVTPIPSGLARPLIESLECDAVMRNSDIDTLVAPPPGGLTGYRQAVTLALARAARGLPDATWDSLHPEPADLLPSDPKWAGEIVYNDVRTAVTTAEPEHIWASAQNAANSGRWYSLALAPRCRRSPQRWTVAERNATTLRLATATRLPGPAWLEITVTPRRTDGSRYTQRAIVFPRGIPGRLYWSVLRPLYTTALRALAHDIIASAGWRSRRRTTAATRAP
ncbi:nucleoside-diphosphate sugar epimerase [Mycobacterium kansasii]|uniref:3 beta-hydroxysteroid dehydrogenase/Delta 5-->4-isomerase n=1 Tax=Mycobacterium innocens TaxID=2341083 RepID=A0A498Q876_9MYCO|nr:MULTISPECIES: DUF2867 domain-containing protein [Mycobacterium]KZS72478.1 nucleoside-diphosphate sugar epimerase [Mycobacterium kansasii]VBA42448.1 3 beta-hydroxysteroid dehydrogenase/Delta 5-->4-isomerase [Mycobacterium innocens]